MFTHEDECKVIRAVEAYYAPSLQGAISTASNLATRTIRDEHGQNNGLECSRPCGHPPLQRPTRLLRAALWVPRGAPSPPLGCRREAAAALQRSPQSWRYHCLCLPRRSPPGYEYTYCTATYSLTYSLYYRRPPPGDLSNGLAAAQLCAVAELAGLAARRPRRARSRRDTSAGIRPTPDTSGPADLSDARHPRRSRGRLCPRRHAPHCRLLLRRRRSCRHRRHRRRVIEPRELDEDGEHARACTVHAPSIHRAKLRAHTLQPRT